MTITEQLRKELSHPDTANKIVQSFVQKCKNGDLSTFKAILNLLDGTKTSPQKHKELMLQIVDVLDHHIKDQALFNKIVEELALLKTE